MQYLHLTCPTTEVAAAKGRGRPACGYYSTNTQARTHIYALLLLPVIGLLRTPRNAVTSTPHQHYTIALLALANMLIRKAMRQHLLHLLYKVCIDCAMEHRHRLRYALANAYPNRFYVVLLAIQFLSFSMADLALCYKSKYIREHTRSLIKINITILQSTYT